MTSSTPLASLLLDWARASVPQGAGSVTSGENIVAEAKQKADAERERVKRLKDPFLPIARSEPAALAKETILWQNDELMVIVDAFSYGPKALVIPKAELLFPTDADALMLDALARTAATVSDAFLDQGANGPARMWINPPSALTVRQLHVHVQPGIPRPGDNKTFYDAIEAYLASALA